MTVAHYLLGDTRKVMSQLPDGCVDLVLTSPPFLALRSYLPADHPDKGSEIGSEPTPAAFLDTLLDCTDEWSRLLTPHGTLAVELGDTYAGSGGAGGDYAEGGLRDGQAKFRQGTPRWDGRPEGQVRTTTSDPVSYPARARDGWPLDKSLTLVPELYRLALAYGRNPLTGREVDRWRVRNVVRWVRPNPPVGALGDKMRPATSDMVVACKARDRWFDLDAVRGEPVDVRMTRVGEASASRGVSGGDSGNPDKVRPTANPAGAPPLDWWYAVELIVAAAVAEGLSARDVARRVSDRLGPSDAWEISPGGFSGKVETKRRVRVPIERARAGGAERTTSPDCPVHAGLPGQLPRALRDARAAERSPRTRRSGDRLEQEPLDGCAPTDPTNDPTGSTPSPTSETPRRECAPAATTRSTASRRTGPAPATTPAGSSSGRTTRRTGDTSESHPSDEPRPGTPESRTSTEAYPTESDPGTGPSTADTSSAGTACTCSYWETITESTSHYAVFPPELLERPIEAMCPRRVCRTCGVPSRRETTTEQVDTGRTTNGPKNIGRSAETVALATRTESATTTTGWTTCGCPGTDGIRLDGYHTGTGWRPGRVLDPFGGTGTTGLVATGRGRDAVLIDLDDRNLDLARERLGMFLNPTTPDELADLFGEAS